MRASLFATATTALFRCVRAGAAHTDTYAPPRRLRQEPEEQLSAVTGGLRCAAGKRKRIAIRVRRREAPGNESTLADGLRVRGAVRDEDRMPKRGRLSAVAHRV